MLLANKLIELLDVIFQLVHRYVLELIIIMFISLFSFWTIGYFANPLYGYHFDLSSCWNGFSAVGGAGVIAAIKYCTDSWKNSPPGEPPVSHTTIFNKFTEINNVNNQKDSGGV